MLPIYPGFFFLYPTPSVPRSRPGGLFEGLPVAVSMPAGTAQGSERLAEPLGVSDDDSSMGELPPLSQWEVCWGSAADAKPDITRSNFPVKFRLFSRTKNLKKHMEWE